jgi:thioesterase domain-containing protein
MGGVLAFEMARQLVASGQESPLVFMIDCSVPTRRRSVGSWDDRESLMAFASDLARTAGRESWAPLEHFRGLDPESLRNGKLEQAIEGSEFAREIGPDRLRRLHDVFRANRLALADYQPAPCPVRVVLVRARSIQDRLADDSNRGWQDLAKGGVTTYELPADHYTIMQRPSVEKLAEILSSETQRLDQGTVEAQPQ